MKLAQLALVVTQLYLSTGCALFYPPRDPNIKPVEPRISEEEFKAILNAPRPEIEYEGEVLRFVHPKAHFMHSLSGGQVPLQLWVRRNKENRKLKVSWCSGEFSKSMEGDDESQLIPDSFKLVHVLSGPCNFVADLLGPSEKLLHRVTHEFTVCGSELFPCGEK